MKMDPPLTDPTALALFARLDVVARLLVEGFMAGMHQSPFKGTSIEFVEHRPYYAGDEVRHIDWRAYGKTGRYFIKEFEEETNFRCYLLVDASGSMGFAGSTLSKLAYARQLAASLAYLLLQQRDAAGLITFDSQIREHHPPSANPIHLSRIVQTLEATQAGNETRLADVFQRLLPTLKRRSLVMILSDFFDEIGPLQVALRQFRAQRHELILFHVVTPEEETFPYSRPAQFQGLEQAHQQVLVDPHRVRAGYLARYQTFCRVLQHTAASLGIDYQKLVTSQPCAKALAACLSARKRSKHTR